jgi:tetratricopeptide (TPR) repeat protein
MNLMHHRFSIFIILSVLIFHSFPLNSPGQSIPYHRKVDRSTILFMFQHGLFKSLNSKLDEYQSAYDRDYQEEDNLFDAFEAFSKIDAANDSLFIKWSYEYPEHYASYAAHAKYYCACARQARGRKWAIDKDQKEYKEMEHYYSLALQNSSEALKKNFRLDVCYAIMVEIGSATDDEGMINKSLADALKNHPYSYRMRLKYLQTMTPRLGGSYEKMKAFIDSCARFVAFNPKLKELSASVPAEKGSIFSYLGKYADAVKMYTEALKYSQDHSIYADRGDAFAHLHDFVNALNDYTQALELSPNNPDYLNRKAQAVANQNSISSTRNAQSFVQREDSRNEGNQNLSLITDITQANEHQEKGSKFASSGNYEEAIKEYNEVIRILPYKHIPYFNRALCYSQLHNDDAALQDFLRVAELKPDFTGTYPRLITIYANRGMYDDALNYANKWVSLEPNNGEPLFNRAKIHERKGSNIDALNDMKQACDLGYNQACRYYNQVK